MLSLSSTLGQNGRVSFTLILFPLFTSFDVSPHPTGKSYRRDVDDGLSHRGLFMTKPFLFLFVGQMPLLLYGALAFWPKRWLDLPWR